MALNIYYLCSHAYNQWTIGKNNPFSRSVKCSQTYG